jgi:putative transcriptional regulator
MEVTVSNTIYNHRSQAGLTQEQLAVAVGVTRQTIIAMERGNYTPSVGLALKLAAVFGVSVEVLFSINHA